MSLKRNVVANYLGQGWTALMGLAFVPLYIRALGMESYGLIGVFALLQAWLTMLDLGMTPTLNREMARFTAGVRSSDSIRSLLRTLEWIAVAIAVLIGVAIWTVSGWLATSWLQADGLPSARVESAVAIIGWVVALRFVESLYRGAILGLQRQVWLSVVGAGFATLRWGGAAVVVVWFMPTIEAFFAWQGLVSLLTILTIAWRVHVWLPRTRAAIHFSVAELKGIWRFAGGVMLTALLALLLTQVDKLILSRLLTLEMFGHYTLAATVAAVLFQATGPITQAYYPRFSELAARGDTAQLATTYHQGAQLVSVMTIPAALMLVLFGQPLLAWWTGDAALATRVAPLLALLAIGTVLNGLIHIPHMLTLAHGWPGFAARMNTVAVAVLVPAILLVTPRYGAIGAATIWVALNAGYVLLGMHYLHLRLLKGELWKWYLRDTLRPALAAMAAAAACWWLPSGAIREGAAQAWVLVSGLCIFAITLLATPGPRAAVIHTIQRVSRHAR